LLKIILYARILNHKEGDNMKGEIAIQALKEINNMLKTKVISNNELRDARIDHTTNMGKCYVSVVFNEKCFKKLIEFNNKTRSTLTECGTFFYGRMKGNTIYVEDFFSDFELGQGEFADASVHVTNRNLQEKKLLTERSEVNHNPYNVVIHFHTHPSYGITDEYQVIKTKTTRYSDQDLYTLAYLQKNHQPTSNNVIVFSGGLLAVDDCRTQISMVYYDLIRKDFYNMDNIYYMYQDKLFKFNNYDITRSKQLDESNCIKLKKELEELK
jgi:hypothetical protein